MLAGRRRPSCRRRPRSASADASAGCPDASRPARRAAQQRQSRACASAERRTTNDTETRPTPTRRDPRARPAEARWRRLRRQRAVACRRTARRDDRVHAAAGRPAGGGGRRWRSLGGLRPGGSMNYCGHCGTLLDDNGRCPTCSAAERGLPRIVEQTAPPPPPPPPPRRHLPPHRRRPPPPHGGRGDRRRRPPRWPIVAMPLPRRRPTSPTRGRRRSAHRGPPAARARRSRGGSVVDDDETTLDDPQSWRRSQLATVGVIAAILLLAGLGVVLWNLLADDPDSLATVPSVASTAAPVGPGVDAARLDAARRRCRLPGRPARGPCRT